MSDDLYPISLEEEITLVAKLNNDGLLTVDDFPPLDSRVRVKKVANTLQKKFSNKLITGGNYFGGEIVDSYFIYNKENESNISYEEAVEKFNQIIKQKNKEEE
ncbi:hypothetical protein ACVRXF_05705 [Streptococcus orisasini]